MMRRKESLRPLWTYEDARPLRFKVIPDLTYHTAQYGDYRFPYSVLRGDLSTSIALSSISLNYFKFFVQSSCPSLKITRYFVFDIILVQPMSCFLVPFFSVDMWLSTSLSHCLMFLHLAQKASKDLCSGVLRMFNQVVS